MIVGIVRETYPQERRVALIPAAAEALRKAQASMLVEPGAGEAAGFTDQAYIKAGASIASGGRNDVFENADIICQVRTLGANPQHGGGDVDHMKSGQIVVGLAEPLTAVEPTQTLASRNVKLFAMELMPRITRAQSMDALSSQATIQGYKAVILAAMHLPKMFPMMMTAAGTLAAAKVFIIGAGVAGLQAIATSRRLGAVVTAYDIRPVVKEQVESLGAKFLEIEIEAKGSEDKGGYAKAMDDEFYRKQADAMSAAVAESDVVITTAAVPGKKSPVLVPAAMVDGMSPGTVIVDLAAERGGNCELTRADEIFDHNGVTILGPTNLAAEVPAHASQMYSKNIVTFLQHIIKDGQPVLDESDEIVESTLMTSDGEIVQRRVRELFNLPSLEADPVGAGAPGGGDAAEGGQPA